MVIIVLGVSGAGKSRFGSALAAALAWRFADGDDFHTPEAVAKMRRAQPLDDADRAPWLVQMRLGIEGWLARGENVVLACSALKENYRRLLRGGDKPIEFVYLKITPRLAAERVNRRAASTGHFMPPELLKSQFEDLEEPEQAVVIDMDKLETTSQQIDQVQCALNI
ncbi:gluconokinase [Gloeobacter violaceus]|uniref:Gluconokinase n=1 Tax=Gloeobacter violaceus (strain ATCC 29082 / PCC 7421) TaxID=251221 RepID=Q7NGS0_GLOVI|nr:gluconokinase [Gloeobacter violaceus]BAC90759.1 gll2818 [Gloeobacter violaceus PCC 7421]